MKHEKGVGYFVVPKSKGLGRLKMVPKSVVGMVWEGQKMKHEKGVACFMVPKSGVGRFWES